MIKILGGVLIVLSCSLFGFYKSFKMKTEADYVLGITNALLNIKKQLSISHKLISELMEGAAEFGGNASSVFSDCARYLSDGSITFRDAWDKAVSDSGICDRRTKEILSGLGAQLGKNDVEGELATVGEATDKLTSLYDVMQNALSREGELYKKAGVLAGAVTVILLY